ncbi:MAG TPA: sigma-70 family RNA polymerase sigma factor [Myxococcales bacterium]
MNSPGPANDLDLVDRVLAGEEAAFAALVDRYHPALVRLASMFVRDRSIAEEVAQDTWMAVLEGLAGFGRRASFKSWLFSILTNRAKTKGEREQRTTQFWSLQGPEESGERAVDPTRFKSNGMWAQPPERWDEDTPEKLAVDKEALSHLGAAIANLPESQRIVLTMRDVEGLDSSEVCNVLGISETNQRVLLHRARSRVRAALEQYLAGES